MLRRYTATFFIFYFLIIGTGTLFLFFIIKLLTPAPVEFLPAKSAVKIGIYLIPSYLIYFFPFVTFLSAILLFRRLSLQNELLAGVSLGMSAWRISSPVLLLSTIITGASYFFSLYLGPQGWRKFEREYMEFQRELLPDEKRFYSYQQFTIYAGSKERGIMKNMFLNFREGPGRQVALFSGEGYLINGYLFLIDGKGVVYSKERAYFFEFEKMKIPLSIFTEKIRKKFFRKSLSTKELFRVAEELKKTPYNPYPLIVEALERMIYPLSTLIFAFLSVPLGFSLSERKIPPAVSGSLLYLLFFSFYLSLKILSNKGAISPFAGIPLPFFLFIIFTIYFMWKKRVEVYRKA